MFYPFTLLQSTLCSEAEMESRQKIVATLASELDEFDTALFSVIQSAPKDLCKDSATQNNKDFIFNALNNHYGRTKKRIGEFSSEFTKFLTNMMGEIPKMAPEKFLGSVNNYEKNLEDLYTRSLSFTSSDVSFDSVYIDDLRFKAFIDDDRVSTTLVKLNGKFKAFFDKYKEVMCAYKKFIEFILDVGKKKAKEKIGKEQKIGVSYGDTGSFLDGQKDPSKDVKDTDKKDGQTSYKTIIIVVVAVVGGLIVVGLLFYELYFKKKNNQRNNENDTEHADVEDLPDDYQNYRNGRGYQNGYRPHREEYQNNTRPHYVPGGNNHPPYQSNDNYRRVD